jgi:hypothetical protein
VIGQRRKRRAVRRLATVTRDQHVGHQAEAVALDGSPQRVEVRSHALVRRSNVAHCDETADPARGVGDRCRGGIGRAEQDFFAGRLDVFSGKIIDAG